MRLPPQAAQAPTRINSADIRPDRLQSSESSPLGLNLAEDVLPDASADIGGRAGEPSPFLLQQVRRDALRFLGQIQLVAAGLVEGGDGLVDFLAADAGAGFEAIGGGELAAGGLLRGEEVAQEDVSVREGFFDDEGVGGVVVEGVADGGGFGGALRGVVVAGGLDDAAEFAVGGCEAGLGFLDV